LPFLAYELPYCKSYFESFLCNTGIEQTHGVFSHLFLLGCFALAGRLIGLLFTMLLKRSFLSLRYNFRITVLAS